MSQKDRDRLKVLHEVERGHLTQPQAGAQLKLIPRSGMGADVGSSTPSRGGRRELASVAGPGLATEDSRSGAGESGEAGPAGVSRLWTHAGDRVSSRAARAGGEQGDAAAVADRSGGVEAEAAAGGGGARVASAAGLPASLFSWPPQRRDTSPGK